MRLFKTGPSEPSSTTAAQAPAPEAPEATEAPFASRLASRKAHLVELQRSGAGGAQLAEAKRGLIEEIDQERKALSATRTSAWLAFRNAGLSCIEQLEEILQSLREATEAVKAAHDDKVDAFNRTVASVAEALKAAGARAPGLANHLSAIADQLTDNKRIPESEKFADRLKSILDDGPAVQPNDVTFPKIIRTIRRQLGG